MANSPGEIKADNAEIARIGRADYLRFLFPIADRPEKIIQRIVQSHISWARNATPEPFGAALCYVR